MACEHMNFRAQVRVARLQESEDGPVTDFMAEVEIECEECKTPFQFIGVPMGLSPDRPMASVDLTELRIPIAPRGQPTLGGMPGFQVVVRE